MTGIMCRSGFLADELVSIAGTDGAIVFPAGHNGPSPDSWLGDTLRTRRVSVVFYEPSFFVDPARFRNISPDTRFVLLASPGEELLARTALRCGAAAVVDKPFDLRDVRGVLDLVLR